MPAKLIVPAASIVGLTLTQVVQTFNDAIAMAEAPYDTLTRKDIPYSAAQDYMNKLYIMKDDMIDCDEEDQVDAREELEMSYVKQYGKATS